MSAFNPANVISALDCIREDLLRSRSTCKTDFVRGLHDRLLEKLAEVVSDLLHESALLAELERDRHTSEAAETLYQIYTVCTSFEAKWIGDGPVSFLDPIHVDLVAEGEGEVLRVAVDYAIAPAAELGDLAALLARIEAETRIIFVAARR